LRFLLCNSFLNECLLQIKFCIELLIVKIELLKLTIDKLLLNCAGVFKNNYTVSEH